MKHPPLRDYVRCPAVQVERTATLAEVAREMADSCIGAVVVVDRGRPVGIVTEHDIITRGIAHRYPVDARVDAVMSDAPATIAESATPIEAVVAFRDLGVRHLPVVDANGALVDVLAADDLLTGLATDLLDIATDL